MDTLLIVNGYCTIHGFARDTPGFDIRNQMSCSKAAMTLFEAWGAIDYEGPWTEKSIYSSYSPTSLTNIIAAARLDVIGGDIGNLVGAISSPFGILI
jgi:hypothetical protein